MTSRFDELGFYTLAGAPESSRALVQEVPDAERMGLGHVFISERLNIKEAATVTGAVGAVSEQLAIATAATNHNTRHPTVTAAFGATMHSLTGGRFTLGLGRGVDRMFDAMGLPHVTTAQIEDFVGLMRRLWQGEMILGHDGPAGSWPLPQPRRRFEGRHPARPRRVRPNSLDARRPVLRPGRAAHLLHRRDHRAVRADGEGARPSRPGATPTT